VLQQIRAELFRQVPARNATEQAARRAVLQAAFGCDSLQAVGRLPFAVLGRGLRALLTGPAPVLATLETRSQQAAGPRME
jgi:hypothetical protein